MKALLGGAAGPCSAPQLCELTRLSDRCYRLCLSAPETAGAGHQRSLEMTSPDKCSSDSSPTLWLRLGPPCPPPDTRFTSKAHRNTGKGGLVRTRAGPPAAGAEFSHAQDELRKEVR